MDITQILLRLGLSLIVGLVIGFEREAHGRAAGFRTTTLTCVSSCMAMILSGMLFSECVSATWRPDPARLAAGILTGMGFLGGAAIIRQENVVRGVTTAAVLWFVSILGLIFGSGHILLGLLSSGIALFVLYVLPIVESQIKTDRYGVLSVTINDVHHYRTSLLLHDLEKLGVTVTELDFDYDIPSNEKIIKCFLKFKKQDHFEVTEKISSCLLAHPSVKHINWE